MSIRRIKYHAFLRYYAFCFLAFHFIRICNGLNLSQLGRPFIHEVRQDPLVWHFVASGIPDMIVSSNFLCLGLDILLAIPMILIAFFSFSQKAIFRLVIIHVLLFAIYLLIIFSFPSLSIRKYLGLALVPIIFLFQDKRNYSKAFDIMRFYVMFIFASSAMWKIVRGAIFDNDQFVNILRNQHLEHLVLFPNHITSQIADWLIMHQNISYIFYLLIALLQLSFLTGFFTRKYDRYLLAGMLLFILGDFLVMRVEYWEFLVFVPLFLSGKNLFRHYEEDELHI